MSIYIHIPFCNTICSYCDFCKFYYNKKYIDKYLESLKKEINYRYQKEEVSSIYIGGGTPTSLEDDELKKLLEITKLFNIKDKIEFTIEGNVESITESKLIIMKEYGVNRISIGVQSFNDNIIKLLERKHNKKEVFNKIDLIKKYFDNINIDLIYAVTDDINIVKKDIDNFLKLDIPHISTYSLILEEHTKLNNYNYKNISEDIDYEMYKYIENKLESNNYVHYEVSNYAKEGYESYHNMAYWNNDYYYGFGLSSVSFINNKRINNTKNLTKYLSENYTDNIVLENKKIRMENEVMLSLRMLNGMSLDKFKRKYNLNLEDVFNIKSLLEEGYLVLANNYLKINKEYIYVSNEILIKMMQYSL